MATSKYGVAKLAASRLTNRIDPVADRYLAWIETKAEEPAAVDALLGASGQSKSPDRVLVLADALYTEMAANPEPAPEHARGSVTYTTASLAAAATEVGVVTMASGFALLTVVTSAPARVRLYVSTAKRDADVARLVTAEPTGDHGLLLEAVTEADLLSIEMSPAVLGYTTPETPSVPITVDNAGAAPAAITVTLTYAGME